MKFPHIFLVVLILLATPICALPFAFQQCQVISVETPASEANEGIPLVFTAKLNAVVPTAKPQFKWTLSAGTITAGDGTDAITVDSAGLGGQNVTATVEVSGISTTCSTVATNKVSVVPTRLSCDRPFDSYGDIKFRDEEARLDNFAIGLSSFEAATGQIIGYAGRQTYKGEVAARLLRAKTYLVKVRGINPERVTTIDGGFSEHFSISLIIVPPGAKPLTPSPTLSPAEVEFTKRRPGKFKSKPRATKAGY